MKKLFTLTLVSVVLIFSFVLGGCTVTKGLSENLQNDMDITRLNDLVRLGRLVESYKEKAGVFPFQGEADVENIVAIATAEQQRYVKKSGRPPYPHKITSATEFVNTLVENVGADTQIPFDPQRVATRRPNWYIYLVRGSDYIVAVHLHKDYPFTQPVAPDYNKLEVTNNPRIARNKGIWLLDDLLANSNYQAAANAEPVKPGYMSDLRKRLGGNSAFF